MKKRKCGCRGCGCGSVQAADTGCDTIPTKVINCFDKDPLACAADDRRPPFGPFCPWPPCCPCCRPQPFPPYPPFPPFPPAPPMPRDGDGNVSEKSDKGE